MNEFKEEIFSELEVEEEYDEVANKKRMKVVGCVSEAEKINRNKRVYPKETLEEAKKSYLAKIKEKRSFCMVDHPEFQGKLGDTASLCRDVYWNANEGKENLLMAEFVVLNTPPGLILQEVLKAGGRPGFSSRGRGKSTLKKVKGHGDVQEIQKGFRFDSFDFVIDPSFTATKIKQIVEGIEIENSLAIAEQRKEVTERLQRDAGIVPRKEETELSDDDKMKKRIKNLAGV